MSLIKYTSRAIGMVVGLIVGFFLIAGPYYTILDNMYDLAVAEGDPTLNAFAGWVYQAFYWGFPSVTVFAILMAVVSLYNVLRRRYYATEEVTAYGS